MSDEIYPYCVHDLSASTIIAPFNCCQCQWHIHPSALLIYRSITVYRSITAARTLANGGYSC
jgi:hypothetical protein